MPRPRKDHVLGVGKQVGQLLAAAVVVVHQGPQLLGQLAQGRRQLSQLLGAVAGGAAAVAFGEGQGQAVEGQELAQEGFGGGHPHLDAGADVEDLIHQPSQGALGAVGDPQQARGKGGVGHGPAALLLHGQGRQGVGGFAGLSHPDGERVGGQWWRRVAELTGVKHAGGDPSELLQQVGPHLGRMAAGAAGQDLDPLHPLVNAVVER